MERPALKNKRVGILRMALRVRQVFGTFEKRVLGPNKRGRKKHTLLAMKGSTKKTTKPNISPMELRSTAIMIKLPKLLWYIAMIQAP